MVRAIFHIGTNKTGSTAIQNFLSSNSEVLAHYGLLYPRSTRGLDYGHHTLASLCNSYDDMYDAIVAIESEYATSRLGSGMVFSSEIFHTVEPFMLSRMFRGYEIQIVAFLRPHLDYYSSWYREDIKSHNFTWDFPTFLDYAARPYAPWLELWSKAFPHGTLTPVLYDRTSMPQGSATAAFLSSALPSANFSGINELADEENISISGNLLHIKRLMNRHLSLPEAQDIVYDVQKLTEVDPAFSGNWLVPDDYADLVAVRFQEDQRAVYETYGIDLSISTSALTGSISPDRNRVSHDLERLIDFSTEHNLSTTKYLVQMSDLR